MNHEYKEWIKRQINEQNSNEKDLELLEKKLLIQIKRKKVFFMNLVHFNNKYMLIFQEEFVFDMSLYGCNQKYPLNSEGDSLKVTCACF